MSAAYPATTIDRRHRFLLASLRRHLSQELLNLLQLHEPRANITRLVRVVSFLDQATRFCELSTLAFLPDSDIKTDAQSVKGKLKSPRRVRQHSFSLWEFSGRTNLYKDDEVFERVKIVEWEICHFSTLSRIERLVGKKAERDFRKGRDKLRLILSLLGY